MITGQCQCTTVRYQVSGDLEEFTHCHCTICRRIHSAAFTSWGGVSRGEFFFTAGEGNLGVYALSDRADSMFCKTCSSTLLVDYKTEPDRLYITLGTVDGNVEYPDGFHIFVGNKAPWYEIADNLPQHDGWNVEPAK